MLGGHGYSRFAMMGEWRNNNDINITWEGDNTILIQQTAKFIAQNLQKKMKGKEVKYKSMSFLNKFDEVTSEKLTLEEPKDLHNLNNITAMLEFRVNILLMKSVGRLAEKIGNKVKPFDAWNETQTFYLQTMTKAFGELNAFNCFRKSLEVFIHKQEPFNHRTGTLFVKLELRELGQIIIVSRDDVSLSLNQK